MSSTRTVARAILPLCAFVMGLCESAAGQPAKTAAPILCPASITVNESAAAAPGWTVTASKTVHPFERISVYNGKPGDQEYDLAPDDEKRQGNRITQTWMLKGYRTMSIFLRCRYRDTSAVLTTDLPPRIDTCVLRFTADSHGRVAAQSAMECR